MMILIMFTKQLLTKYTKEFDMDQEQQFLQSIGIPKDGLPHDWRLDLAIFTVMVIPTMFLIIGLVTILTFNK